MLRLPESHQTSDMHDLSMIFDQQDLFTTNGAIDCYNCLDVISFSRTFNDFTSKLFDGFLFMKYEEFYQDIYNNNISMDTGSSSVSFMILSAIEQVLFELLSRIKRCKHPSVSDILATVYTINQYNTNK